MRLNRLKRHGRLDTGRIRSVFLTEAGNSSDLPVRSSLMRDVPQAFFPAANYLEILPNGR
jgi:hypothetical protein